MKVPFRLRASQRIETLLLLVIHGILVRIIKVVMRILLRLKSLVLMKEYRLASCVGMIWETLINLMRILKLHNRVIIRLDSILMRSFILHIFSSPLRLLLTRYSVFYLFKHLSQILLKSRLIL